MSATKRFRNTSERPQRFKIWIAPNMSPHEFDVAPGEECEIPKGYAGNFIKRRAPGLKACDELDSEADKAGAEEEQAKLDDIARLAKEAEELANLEEAEELSKLEAEEAARLEEREEAKELATLEAEEDARLAKREEAEGLAEAAKAQELAKREEPAKEEGLFKALGKDKKKGKKGK